MTDQSMVERVAAAISGDCVLPSMAHAVARAAIEAMREPAEEMIAAARRNNHPRDEETWRTMVDAALKDQP